MSAPLVRRFAHGSRVPGWDRAADLEKDPAQIPDPAVVDVPADLRAEIEHHMEHYPDRRSAALPALAAAQRLHGWCSPEAIDQVACVMRLTPAYLSAVATFYDMLETDPVGRHSVYVCTNISCSLRGADALLDAVRDAAADEPQTFNVRSFECLGACDIAPMISVDGVYVGPVELEDVPALLDDVRNGRPVLADKQLIGRTVADPHANSQAFPPPSQRAIATPEAATPAIAAEHALVGEPPRSDRLGGPAPVEGAPPVEHAAGRAGSGDAVVEPADTPQAPDTGTTHDAGVGPGEEEAR